MPFGLEIVLTKKNVYFIFTEVENMKNHKTELPINIPL